MAVVTFVKYKPGKNSTVGALKGVINYCNQPYKTEIDEQLYSIDGKDCNGNYAYREFMATKKLYNKVSDVMFYHYVQSFSPEEDITPEEANKIGLELAKEFDGFEVLVATHIDRKHIHNHLIINSVSYENGLKLRQNPKSLEKLRGRSDEICRKFGKTTLPKYKKPDIKGLSTREYRVALRGESFKFQLMVAIDNATNKSGSKIDFEFEMKQLGYEMTWTNTRKYITFTCPNGMKCRDIKLHDKKYLKENLENELKFRQAVLSGEAKAEQLDRYFRDGERAVPSDSLCAKRGAIGVDDDNAKASNSVSAGALQPDFTACNVGGTEQSVCGDSGYRSGLYEQNGGKCAGGKSTESSENRDSVNADEGEYLTGWEESRGIYFGFVSGNAKKDNLSRLGDIKTSPKDFADSDFFGGGIGSAIGAGLASAERIIDTDSEDPEQRRRRIEAEENGNTLGALVGLAVGLAVGIHDETQTEDEENYSGPVIGGI